MRQATTWQRFVEKRTDITFTPDANSKRVLFLETPYFTNPFIFGGFLALAGWYAVELNKPVNHHAHPVYDVLANQNRPSEHQTWNRLQMTGTLNRF